MLIMFDVKLMSISMLTISPKCRASMFICLKIRHKKSDCAYFFGALAEK